MPLSTIEFEKRGSVAEIRLNRPEKLNAINSIMIDELESVLNKSELDENIRVILLSGNGRAYSAGFDFDIGSPPEEMSESEFMEQELKRSFDLIMRFWDCPIPTIAAVHGYCLGSSMEISAACDITIASEDCRFGAPEVRFGSGIVCLILPWIIGLKNANEILLEGNTSIDAQRAQAIGLINRVVPTTKLMDEARSLAHELSLNDPLAVRLTKKAIKRTVEISGMRQALIEALETNIEIETTETPESKAFNNILESDGLKAALTWRAEQFPKTKE